MSKALDLGKISTKAGFNYFWGLVISNIISSVGTIFIINLLGSEAYGLYGLALTVPNLLMLFRDWGINKAMVRYTAQYRAENREPEIKSIFLAGIVFEIAMGLIMSILLFLMAGNIAQFFKAYGAHPELTTLIQIVSFSILAHGLTTAATAVFTGTEKTTYNSIMLICQYTLKTLLIICFVITGFGTIGALSGLTLSFAIAGLIGMAFTIILYRKIPKTTNYKLNLGKYLKGMLKYSTPVAILAVLSGFLAQFYIMIYGYFFEDIIPLGNYNAAFNFVVLITFFSLSITTMLFPAFSKLDIKKDKTTLKNLFQASVKYSALIVVPVAFIVMCLATQAVTILFPQDGILQSLFNANATTKLPDAPLFLALLSINYLTTAVGSLSIGNIIDSQGQTGLNLKFTILTAAIGFPMGYILIHNYSILGLIFTTIVAPLPSLILSIIWVKKHYDLTIDWISSAKILLSSTITAALTYMIVYFIHLSALIELIIGIAFFTIVLIGALILTKTLSPRDIDNLRTMTTNIGPITKIIHFILNNMEKTMTKLKLN
ncbi:MAG: oligosaccharide flippase family protein [Candidatus Bathyarchaeota archaeon]|uniref:oligosaccharide flippase family protein n=1 Tax=Candidatus Bathycorpusculum sp. TaxID=2994959 RepID=UPI0028280837|nr:oligosaccharide flippase family protein [Candidatus Termiticorpusculum sp.]MCL2258132.1 oligosaccharide flippase family protein [Candidatus Termiticorpusculum sp.]MCL2291578.1 oligosaccharide flippase family protein [Candidatus Termiticorpusculum sp.]